MKFANMSWCAGNTAQGQNNILQNNREAMEICCTDIYIINNKHYLYIVVYHRKSLVISQVEGLKTHNLIQTV